MTDMSSAILFGLLILGSSIWIGGILTVVIVARASAAHLGQETRVAFFRDFGRNYGIVATAALIVAYICGGILLAGDPWDGMSTALTACAAALVVALAVGVAQARRMTRLRHRLSATPDDGHLTTRIARSARLALVLRAGLVVLTLGIFVVAVVRWA